MGPKRRRKQGVPRSKRVPHPLNGAKIGWASQASTETLSIEHKGLAFKTTQDAGLLRSRMYTCARIEQLIREVETPMSVAECKKLGIATKGHAHCDPRQWVGRLMDDILASSPTELHDGNMYLARELGSALLAWVLRLQRAKAYDPNRPKAIRQKALERWQAMCTTLFLHMIDERGDAVVWSGGQQWDPPFTAYAKDGSFV